MKKNIYKQIKYKKYIRMRSVIPIINKLRILNFKRPKWNLLKKNIYKTIQLLRYSKRFRKKRFLNKFYFQEGYFLPWFYKSYKKNYFKQLLHAKINFFYFYSVKTSVKKIKKKVFKNKIINSSFMISLFESRPDIILWRSGFCSSPAVARFMINHNKLYINNVQNRLTFIELRTGDLLQFKNIFKTNLNTFFNVLVNNNFIFLKEHINFINNYNIEVNWNTFEIVFLGTLKQKKIQNIILPKYLNPYRVSKYLRLL